MLSNNELKTALLQAGFAKGDIIFVESRQLDRIIGGAETLVSCLLEIIGEEGTLVSYAHGYNSEPSYDGQADCLEVEDINKIRKHMPTFNQRMLSVFIKDPVCVNMLRREESLQSSHDGHLFVAIGRHAEVIVNHQSEDFPLFLSSPFERLVQLSALGLMIDCGMKDSLLLKYLIGFDHNVSIRLNNFRPFNDGELRKYLEHDDSILKENHFWDQAYFKEPFNQFQAGGNNFIYYDIKEIVSRGRRIINEEK